MALSNRQKIYDNVLTRLKGIIRAEGYSTQPKIVSTEADAFESEESVTIWAEITSETFNPDANTLSGGGPVGLEITVSALIRADRGDLATLSNAALQDVRNALDANWNSYPDDTGAYKAGFDECTTDEGMLSYQDMTLLTQPVVFSYNAGPTW